MIQMCESIWVFEEGSPFLRSYYIISLSYLSWSCNPHSCLCTCCVFLAYYSILHICFIIFVLKAYNIGVLLIQMSHHCIFTIMFLLGILDNKYFNKPDRNIKLYVIKKMSIYSL